MSPRHPAALMVALLLASALTLPAAQASDAAPAPGQGRWATLSGVLMTTADENPVYAVAPDEGPLVPVTGDLRDVAGYRVTVRVRVPPALDALDGTWRAHEALQAWGRPLAAEVLNQTAVASAATAVQHTVYVARLTSDGAPSMSDAQVLEELGMATEFWVDEADGRIAGFDLPDSPADEGRFATYETTADIATVCSLGGESSFFALAEEAAALFPQGDFGGPDQLVVLTPDQAGCPASSPIGRASMGSGFSSGGVAMARSAPGRVSGTLAHELGHNFGFDHSNVGETPYLNLYNVMGTGVAGVNELTALSTAYRVGAGIEASGEIKSVAISDPTEPVTLTDTLAPRTAEDGQRALAVTPPDTGKTFYIEYRSGLDQDAGSAYALGAVAESYVFGPGVVVEEIWEDAGHGVSLLPDRENSWRTSSSAGDTWDSPSGTVAVTVGQTTASEAEVTVEYTPPPPFDASGQVTLDSSPTVGSNVTANLSGTIPSPARVTWLWLLDGSPIPSANASSYVPSGADHGRELSVVATAYAPGRLPAQLASAPETVRPGVWTWTTPPAESAPVAPGTPPSGGPAVLTGPKPIIKGKAVVGKRLTAKTGNWPAGTTFAYRWLANGTVVRKAASAALRLSPALAGKRLSLRVTAAKPGYVSVTLVSAKTKKVLNRS